MNNEQQAQAKDLYFQTDLTKTQIAEILNIPRRTLHYWIREKNWDRLKKSAAHMPSLIAENCYHIMARLSQQILSEDRIMRPITHHEADTLHKLTITIGKLKNRSTLNESIEMFGFFMESVNSKSPELANQVMPLVDDYIAERGSINAHQFKPDAMNDTGLYPARQENVKEIQLDMQDIMEWDMAQEQPLEIEQISVTNHLAETAHQDSVSEAPLEKTPQQADENQKKVKYTLEEIQKHLKDAKELLARRARRQALLAAEEFVIMQNQHNDLSRPSPQNTSPQIH